MNSSRGSLCTNGAELLSTFRIPEYRFAGQSSVPKFRTGELSLDLHQVKQMINNYYHFQQDRQHIKLIGILETEQETIIATRNAEIVRKLLMMKL